MNLPNKITLSRIIAIALMLIAVFTLYVINLVNPFESMIISLGAVKLDLVYLILFVFFVLASFTDMLDGKIARKRNLVTNLGKFMDPVADKLLVNSMLLFLAVPSITAPYNHTNPLSISIWCAILMVARDIVVEAIRFIAAQKNVVIAANIFGKLKTVFQMVTIAIVLINGFPFAFFDTGFPVGLRITDILVYVTTVISVLSGVIYVVQNRHVLKENTSKKMDAIKLIKEKGYTLGSAESFTGGLFAREITMVPGASSYFKGTVVSYATEEKINVLGVDKTLTETKGVVSSDCAEAMASGAQKVLNVDIAVSFTGNAGPDTMEGKPCGEVYIGIVIKDKTHIYPLNLKGNRDQIQTQAVELAFSYLVDLLK